MFMTPAHEIRRQLQVTERRARQLLHAGAERAAFLLKNSPVHSDAQVARWLAERAHRRRFEPEEALLSAELAVKVADSLEPPDAAASGYAWAALGNVLRIHDQMERAEESLAAALASSQDARDGRLMRRVHSYYASLFNATMEFEAATEHLRELHRLAEEHGETFDAGVALISLARTTYNSGDSRGATHHLATALTTLPRSCDADTVMSAIYSLVAYLIELGSLEEAEQYADSASSLADELGGLWPFQHRWLKGRILRESGQPRQAALLLQDSATFFRLSSLHYNEHLLYLDLAQAELRSGQLARAEQLAERALQFFRELRLPGRASEAVELLAEAVTAQQLTAALLRRVLGDLGRVSRSR